MIKIDEAMLARIVLISAGRFPQSLDLDEHFEPKRWQYVLSKWEKRDWWEYGVSLRYGWLTPLGKEKLTELVEKFPWYYKPGPFQLANGWWAISSVPNEIRCFSTEEEAWRIYDIWRHFTRNRLRSDLIELQPKGDVRAISALIDQIVDHALKYGEPPYVDRTK